MKQTEQWTSKLGFIMAAAGSTIGLGAIWKFLISLGRVGRSVLFNLYIIYCFNWTTATYS